MTSAVKINKEAINYNSSTDYHVVFDLDECLVHTMNNGTIPIYHQIMKERIDLRSRLYQFDLVDIGTRKGQGATEAYWGVTRPHLDKFLDFCYEYFRSICVWSAGQPSYVRAIVSRIFQGRPQPMIIFTSEHIVQDSRCGYHKPLASLVSLVPGIMSMEKTFFLDDRASNFITCPQNAVIIPRYEPTSHVNSIEEDDDSFRKFAEFLIHVRYIPDIRSSDKSRIFDPKLFKSRQLEELAYLDIKYPTSRTNLTIQTSLDRN